MPSMRWTGRHAIFRGSVFLGEWETPYLTMSAEYESATARLFGKFLERGYVYKGPAARLLVHP